MFLPKVKFLVNFFSPDIFILDDPTSSLDNKVSHCIMRTITEEELWKNRTFLISTNNFALLHYFDKVIFIDNGKIIHFATPDEIKASEEFKQISIEEEEVEHNEVIYFKI